MGIPLRDHDLIEPNVPPVWFNKKQYLKKSARKKEVRFTGRWARKEQLDGKEGLLQGQGITWRKMCTGKGNGRLKSIVK